jgi:DNA-binding response OmpR family regulator
MRDQFSIIGLTESTKISEILEEHRPYGILVDIYMSGMKGIELHDQIVKNNHYNGCPIFFITSHISDETRLKTIPTTAIDCLDRLMNEKEMRLRLLNRIKVFLQGTPVLDVGNLKLDSNTFTVFISGQSLELTLIEMRILSLMMRSLPYPVEKIDLIEKIWGDIVAKGKIYVHLSNLRAKLEGWDHEIKVKGNQVLVVPRQ